MHFFTFRLKIMIKVESIEHFIDIYIFIMLLGPHLATAITNNYFTSKHIFKQIDILLHTYYIKNI